MKLWNQLDDQMQTQMEMKSASWPSFVLIWIYSYYIEISPTNLKFQHLPFSKKFSHESCCGAAWCIYRSVLKVLFHTTPRYPAEICWISPTGSAGEGPEVQTTGISAAWNEHPRHDMTETTTCRYSSFYLVVIENNYFVLISDFSGIPSLKPT